METYIEEKEIHGKIYRYTPLIKSLKDISKEFLVKNQINSWVVNDIDEEELALLAQLPFLEKISFIGKYYDDLSILNKLPNIENCGDIPSLDFLLELPNLKIVYIIGDTSIKDHRIKHILDKESVQELHISMNKNYDITFKDIREKNG